MTNDLNIFDRVNNLKLPTNQYVIVGSGSMDALGIRKARDLDIAVTKNLYQKLLLDPTWSKDQRHGRVFLVKDLVEIIPTLEWEAYPTTAEQAIASAMIINGVPFMNLDELIKFKKALGRDKDFADIELIKKYQNKKRINKP